MKKQTRRSLATGQKTLRGITLIETILYLSLVVLVMGAFFSYGWDIVETDVKSTVIAQTTTASQDIERRIAYEIRRAESVSSISASRIVLQESGGEVAIEASDGTVTVKRGSDDAVALQASDIAVDNFSFTHQDSSTGEVQYIGFSFTAVAAYPGSTSQNAYKYSLPVQSGAALRTQ